MGLRFHRSVSVLPGVRVNFSKGIPSVSLGRRGLHYTIGAKGNRLTAGLPGTGLSYTDYEPHHRAEAEPGSRGRRRSGRTPLFGFVVFSALMLAMWAFSVMQDGGAPTGQFEPGHARQAIQLIR
jgi:hypothetical protein